MNGADRSASDVQISLPKPGAFNMRETNVSWRTEIAQAKANIGNPMNH